MFYFICKRFFIIRFFRLVYSVLFNAFWRIPGWFDVKKTTNNSWMKLKLSNNVTTERMYKLKIIHIFVYFSWTHYLLFCILHFNILLFISWIRLFHCLFHSAIRTSRDEYLRNYKPCVYEVCCFYLQIQLKTSFKYKTIFSNSLVTSRIQLVCLFNIDGMDASRYVCLFDDVNLQRS